VNCSISLVSKVPKRELRYLNRFIYLRSAVLDFTFVPVARATCSHREVEARCCKGEGITCFHCYFREQLNLLLVSPSEPMISVIRFFGLS
jgi:hypothetical protein